jgi:hypothetical protein
VSPSNRGQASAEYVGAVLLVALALIGAATAVAAPGLAEAVVRELRRGLCIVGGDICTRADARERGLQPCPLEAVGQDLSAGPTVLFVRIGGQNGTEIVRRSDGTFEYSRYRGISADVTAGAGLQLGPVVQVGAGASAGFAFRSGETWLLEEEAGLFAFERLGEKPEPAVRYREGGARAEVGASLGIGDDERETTLASGSLGVRAALGRRIGPGGRTTWYFEHAADAGADLGQSLALFEAGARRVVEWQASDPPVITVREARSEHGGRVVEKVGRLVLTDPADRASARRWALAQPSPPLAALWAADFARRLRERGTLERYTFDESTDTSGWNVGIAAGAKLGAEKTRTKRHRKLVSAEVLGGPVPGRRSDCLYEF